MLIGRTGGPGIWPPQKEWGAGHLPTKIAHTAGHLTIFFKCLGVCPEGRLVVGIDSHINWDNPENFRLSAFVRFWSHEQVNLVITYFGTTWSTVEILYSVAQWLFPRMSEKSIKWRNEKPHFDRIIINGGDIFTGYFPGSFNQVACELQLCRTAVEKICWQSVEHETTVESNLWEVYNGEH